MDNSVLVKSIIKEQKENLDDQGKAIDYLELYKMVEEGEEIRGEV